MFGLVVGIKIPFISSKIMQYKKCDKNINRSGFLYSKIIHIIICIFNGIVWGLAGLNKDNLLVALLISILVTLGIIIAYIDINIKIIPNETVLAIVIMGIIFQTMNYGLKSLLGAFASMVVMMVVFTSVAAFVGFGKVGAGDIKLAGAMGIALGYPLIMTAVIIMAIVLLVFIIAGMAMKKIYLSTMLPFAPFMISGFVAALITFVL
jgi:leader peptidase (prepilin peptidase)/N-methyltransferase